MEMYQGTVDAIINAPAISVEELSTKIIGLEADADRLRSIVERQSNEINDYRLKFQAVEGHIADIYSEDGEIDDRVKEIAEYLGITLTKRISGDATFTISWSAQVPLDFDPDDFEISFDVDCDTYEAEDFEWNEENTDINAEED